jgi:hypothetical protein
MVLQVILVALEFLLQMVQTGLLVQVVETAALV